MATAFVPQKQDRARDAQFKTALHGKNSTSKTGFVAAISKNADAQKAAVAEYFKHWDNKRPSTETEDDKKTRLEEYATLTKHYYNLVTDFYEYGWGTSFHFSRFYKGEAFRQSIARHEHYLALKMGLTAGMKVLDVGCGVGGPAQEICRFTDCNITGLNNNDYQVERANHYANSLGLADKLNFVKGDFMQMDFEPETFDAVYAIEATVHAPVLDGVYGEIYKVLKPGGTFGVYEWVMTDKYDESIPLHREVCYGIEIGDGIPKMYKTEIAEQALKNVGFEIVHQEDLAARNDDIPWYYPLSPEFKYCRSIGDLVTIFRTSWLGRQVTMKAVGLLEKLHLAPAGSQKVTEALEEAAVNLVLGAKLGLFTPMMLFIAKKPL
ncbi:S-adenosyl-L-methionine-dependent methyltransferase [Lipomyces doorenjongii]|uniref:S-adenosyl-L-methionine-dependent methyltransferase n=1 Tax=Lipomyces doorenjongii TaxID=383834 RepID=UPI003343414A